MTISIEIKIRQVTDEDRGLPYGSYSKLSNFDHCPLNHKIKYIDKNYSNKSTLPMEIGSISHKVLEIKGHNIIKGTEINYDELNSIYYEGYDEIDEKSDNHILGVTDLKRKYFEEYFAADNKSGMNYEEKSSVFLEKVLPSRMEDPIWHPIAVEKKFEFVYDNRIIIHGFIDRIDQDSSGNLKIIDYKTSKAVFREEDIKTPMQHVIYDLACIHFYGKIPIEHEYDFIFLNKIQNACTKGYFNRGIKKLNKILDKMEEMENNNEFVPKPSPLCYWCPYHSDSPNADPKYSGLCIYHSLWTPENKNFKVLNRYGEKINKPTERKLIF